MTHDIVEEIRVSGRELIDRVRELLQEGNIRRMVIINGKGVPIFKVPLALGVIGMGGAFAIAPILASIAAFAFLVKDTRIIVERYPESDKMQMTNELYRDPGKRPYHKKRKPGHDPFEIDIDYEVLD